MKKSYIDWTYNSKNPLRRFAHRSRFKKSLNHISLQTGDSLLDFGCGDGLFLNQLKNQNEHVESLLIGFEPYLKLLKDNKIEIFRNWIDVVEQSQTCDGFDYVTAFEVFEHFNKERQIEALDRIKSVLSEKGLLVISVPIEKGMIVLLKTAIRRVNHPHNKHLYNIRNAVKSFFGKSLPEYRSGDNYLSHLGFYFSDLEEILKKDWVIQSRSYSPLRIFNYHFNSQVFYTLKAK